MSYAKCTKNRFTILLKQVRKNSTCFFSICSEIYSYSLYSSFPVFWPTYSLHGSLVMYFCHPVTLLCVSSRTTTLILKQSTADMLVLKTVLDAGIKMTFLFCFFLNFFFYQYFTDTFTELSQLQDSLLSRNRQFKERNHFLNNQIQSTWG